ncbi:MAG: hypothetical protein ACOY94_28645 [Bacillota bacterium]
MGGRIFVLALLLLTLALTGCGGRPEPTLEVSAEQRGSGLVILMKTTNFRLGQDGHAHVRLNGGPEAMIYSNTYTIPKLDPGVYTIEVELSNVKHENLGIKQTIQHEVKP